MRLGIDVDGVAANFNASFIPRCIRVTGRDLFPHRPFPIPLWDYPQHYGYSEAEVRLVWEEITKDERFWADLPVYSWTRDFLGCLEGRASVDDVYFITSRPGVYAKHQTEEWIAKHGGPRRPTVLISSEKGLCAKALRLDAYIDDRDKNVIDVRTEAPYSRTFLLDHPWNRTFEASAKGIERIDVPNDMFRHLGVL